MGKAGRNEMKRVAANFLNGAAVAMLAAGCIGPVVAEVMDLGLSACAVLASAVMHAMALSIVGDVED
jgi:cytochrome c biogenesis protein CcdA